MNQFHSTPVMPERFLSVTVTTAPLEVVANAVHIVLSRIAPDRFHSRSKPLDIDEIYGVAPSPGGSHLFNVVAYSPRLYPGNCAIVTNVSDGWSSLSYLIAREHKAFQVQILSTQAGVEYPMNRIEVWRDGQSTRVVMVMRDSDKWVFFEKGEPESVENTQLYEQKIKRKCRERNILLNYMTGYGWDLNRLDFWNSSADALYLSEMRKK